MKTIKLLCVVLCISMLLSSLVGCNKDAFEQTTTDSPTDATEPEELYDTEDHFVSFISYNRETKGHKTLKNNSSFACKFTVTEGYLSQFNAMMDRQIGDAMITLYKWNDNYEKTIASNPIKQVTFLKEDLFMYESMLSCNMEIKFEENEVSKGTYLYVISMVPNSSNPPTILTGRPWTINPIPEEYAEEYSKYDLTYFRDGKETTAEAAQTSFILKTQVPHVDVIEEPIPAEKDPDSTAKVIILAGQSNAVGRSRCDFLGTKVSPEKFAEYTNGYSNVQIMYDCNNGNESGEFVNVALGQGASSDLLGPEIGLAEYLSENFPDEKFYIIKYAKGGSDLETQWYNAKKESIGTLLTGMTEFVNTGLLTLQGQGLDPKIIGFLWNQGESDATHIPQAARYYANLEGLVDYVRTTFADYASVKGISFFDAAISNTVWPAYMTVNMQKKEFCATSPINFYIDIFEYPEILHLEENFDVAHYDSIGMLKLGQLYGEQIAKILK